MRLVLVQYTADHTLIDQERFRRSRGREDQFGTGIGLSFRYGRMYTMGKHKIISNTIYLRFRKGFESLRG